MSEYLANKILSETPSRAVDYYVRDTRKDSVGCNGLPLIEVEYLADPKDSSTWEVSQNV